MEIPEFALERYFARFEFRVRHHLASSTLETLGLRELLDLADAESRPLFETLQLGYTEAPGHPLLRAEVASLYDGLGPDDILVFSGAQEAIFALANVTLRRGDHAVVLWPAYQSLHEVARAAGAEVTLVPLRHEAAWRIDVSALEAACRPGTRLLVVNFPHNPTGSHPDRATFESIVALADRLGAVLLSDEVYRLSEHEPGLRLPAAAEISPRAVSLGVMSKSFGLAGLRIGWVATRDRALLAGLAAFKDYLTICNAGPSEALATIALRARDRILARNLAIVRENLGHLDAFFQEWGSLFEWVRPRAGAVAFPRLRDGSDASSFARSLREEADVLILPGSVFGHGGGHFRIGFGQRSLPTGLRALRGFLERRDGRLATSR
ncbi:MAG TPA: aminotransferase class I/II-fold pyridoxal phosphate-dependent enzyme [Vicinamibacteria bacterium]|jgi:aspartate/methionine/tyrosine aminotransferase